MFRNISLLCVLTLALVATGCSGGGQSSVTGKVTLDGAPLAEGTLSFAPAEGSKGSPTGAMVKDGVYTIDSEPGIAPGTYIVSCNSFEAKMPEGGSLLDGSATAQAPEDRIPASWNEQKTKIEVKSGKNTFDFEINSK